jgi:hypothetical protein
MLVVEQQAWRRPIQAHAEETYDYTWGKPERSIMWYLHGPHQEEDAERLAKGMACGVCLSVFPVRPALENTRAWRPYAKEWVTPVRDEADVMSLVAQGKCPTCASEVRDEMHDLMHRGVDPLRPKGMDE